MNRTPHWVFVGMVLGAMAGGLAAYAAAREAERQRVLGATPRLSRQPLAWMKLLMAVLNVVRQMPQLVYSDESNFTFRS